MRSSPSCSTSTKARFKWGYSVLYSLLSGSFFVATFFVTWISVSPYLSMHERDWCRCFNLNLPAAGWDLSHGISRRSINEMQPERGMWSRQFATRTALCIEPFTSLSIWGAMSVWASPFCLPIKGNEFLWMETFNGMEINSLFTLQSQIPDSLVRELSHNRHFLSLLLVNVWLKRSLKLQGQLHLHLIFSDFLKYFIFKRSKLIFKFLICLKQVWIF